MHKPCHAFNPICDMRVNKTSIHFIIIILASQFLFYLYLYIPPHPQTPRSCIPKTLPTLPPLQFTHPPTNLSTLAQKGSLQHLIASSFHFANHAKQVFTWTRLLSTTAMAHYRHRSSFAIEASSLCGKFQITYALRCIFNVLCLGLLRSRRRHLRLHPCGA